MKISKKILEILLTAIMMTGFGAVFVTNGPMIVNAENAPETKSVAEPTPIATLFPDTELAAVIASNLKKADANAPVTQADLDSIVTIVYSGNGRTPIKSIAGLQHLTNLATLYMDYHAIRDLSPLSQLKNLTNLNVKSNEITDINALANLTRLKELLLDMNDITDVSPLKHLVNLTNLDLKYNTISNIRALETLTKLTDLDMSFNQISDLSPISSLTNLLDLKLEFNKIRDLSPLTSLTKLQVLNLDRNNLVDITPLGKLTNLRELFIGKEQADAAENKIADFSVLKSLSNLENLHVQGQGIARIPQEVLTRVKLLNARYSALTDITPFLKLDNLTTLRLDGNNFKDMSPFKGIYLPNLKDLDLSCNGIIDITPFKAAKLPQIQKINLADQSNNNTPVLAHSEQITVENFVKDVEGNLIKPSRILPLGKGAYTEPNIVWRIAMPNKQTWVSYLWNQKVKIAGIRAQYNGVYTVEVFEHYPVNFMVDERVHAALDEKPGVIITSPVDPVKEGYAFTGWYTGVNEGRKWKFETDKTPRKPLSLYAQFSGNKHQLTYDNEGEVDTVAVAFGSKLKDRPVEPKTGYTFAGWFTEPIGGEKWDFATSTMPNHNMTLYAQYTQNVYHIIFDNEGAVSEALPVNFGELVFEPERPTKIGYSFTGWYTEINDGHAWNFATDTMPAYDMTLHARYIIQRAPGPMSLTTRAQDITMHKSELIRIQDQLELEATLIALSDVKVVDEDGTPVYDIHNAKFAVSNLDELNNVLDTGQYDVRIAYVSPLPEPSESEVMMRSFGNSMLLARSVPASTNLLAEPAGLLTTQLSTEVKMTVLADAPDVDPGEIAGGTSSSQNPTLQKPKLSQTGQYTNEYIVFGLVLILSSMTLLLIVYLKKKQNKK